MVAVRTSASRKSNEIFLRTASNREQPPRDCYLTIGGFVGQPSTTCTEPPICERV